MKFIKTGFEGVLLVDNKLFKDNRGEFQKLYQTSSYKSIDKDFTIDEHFFSVSQKGVIRGMHFQLPPYSQAKLVYVLSGKVIDVLVDLRRNSNTFKQFITFDLDSEDRKALFIPEGIAHGFQSLTNNTVMVYLQSKEFNPDSDFGINPFSIGMKWPINEFIVSEKDRNLVELSEYLSHF